MFAASAGPQHSLSPSAFAAMLGALRGSSGPMAAWQAEDLSAALGGAPTGILPEDEFDRQPWQFGKLSVVAAGRLDDRRALLARLGIRGGETMADSEIIARACARWGTEVPQHLYGEWALAMWDAAERRLFAAVDHVGCVRLYFHRQGHVLHLATQLAALMAHPDVRPEIDRRLLGLHVAPRVVLGTTMFREIEHLPGGSSLTWQEGDLSIRRWWQPDTATRARFRRDSDYVEEAKALFDAAVAARLRTSGGIVAALSGGLDSPLVAATAARRLARPLPVYTSVPEPGLALEERRFWDADDWPFAAAVAAMHPNMVHHRVAPDGQAAVDVFPEIHRSSRTPARNATNQVWYLRIARAAQTQGARVILGGDRGNVSLTVDGAYGPRDWASADYYRFHLRRLGRRLRDPRSWHALAGRPRHANTPALRRGGDRLRAGADLLSPEFRAAHREELRPLGNADPHGAFLKFATMPEKLPSPDLMALFGCEWRDPMRDRRLLEALITYPFSVFRAGGRDRGLARAVAKGRLPDMVRLRTNRGAQAPDAAAWVQAHEARYRAAFAIVRASPIANEIIDMVRTEQVLDALCAGDRTQDCYSLHRALDAGMFASTFEAGEW